LNDGLTANRRVEDRRLITGTGAFVDDIKLEGMLYAVFLRSPMGHAKIKSIDVSRAESEAPSSSSLTILKGSDINFVLPMISIWPGRPQPPFPLLAKDEVKYFGQPVLAIAAESRAKAEDALESIDVDFEFLPSVVETEKALDSGAPLVHEDLKTNVIGSWSHSSGDIQSAQAQADVIIEQRFEAQRVTGQAIEPRGALASYDPKSGKL